MRVGSSPTGSNTWIGSPIGRGSRLKICTVKIRVLLGLYMVDVVEEEYMPDCESGFCGIVARRSPLKFKNIGVHRNYVRERSISSSK